MFSWGLNLEAVCEWELIRVGWGGLTSGRRESGRGAETEVSKGVYVVWGG